MKPTIILNPREYDPNLLLDALQQTFHLKNDAALSRFLRVHTSVISKLRCRRLQISSRMIISFHDATGMSIRQLRALMGDHRPFCLLSEKNPYVNRRYRKAA